MMWFQVLMMAYMYQVPHQTQPSSLPVLLLSSGRVSCGTWDAFICPKFCFLFSGFLKYLVPVSGMANSVDLDQIKKPSDLGLHCLHMAFGQKLWCTKLQDIYLLSATVGVCSE